MATTITFYKSPTTVTLPGPPGGYPIRRIKPQALGLTSGGTRYTQDKGGPDRYQVELLFDDLTDSEKEALDGFYNTTVDGVTNTFTYTDTDGTGYTARFLDTILEFTKTANNQWGVRVLLELTTMAG